MTENPGVCDLGGAERRLLPRGSGWSCQMLLRGQGRGGPGICRCLEKGLDVHPRVMAEGGGLWRGKRSGRTELCCEG